MSRKKVTDEVAIVAAAARLFEQRGYRNTTIQDIADHLGIAKPTIYAHIENKAALLEAIFEEVLGRIKNELSEIVDSHKSPTEEIRAIIGSIIVAAIQLRPYFLIFFSDERELDPRTRRHFRLWAREVNELVEGVITRASKAGELPAGIDPKIATNLLLGMVTSVMRWYKPDGPADPSMVTEQVMTLLGFQTQSISEVAS